jgi:hypothetical protein
MTTLLLTQLRAVSRFVKQPALAMQVPSIVLNAVRSFLMSTESFANYIIQGVVTA